MVPKRWEIERANRCYTQVLEPQPGLHSRIGVPIAATHSCLDPAADQTGWALSQGNDWTIHRRPWDRRPPNMIGRRPTAVRRPTAEPTEKVNNLLLWCLAPASFLCATLHAALLHEGQSSYAIIIVHSCDANHASVHWSDQSQWFLLVQRL